MQDVTRPRLISLMFLISFGAVGIGSISPALPEIREYFQISTGNAQYIILWYLVGYTLGLIPYGALASYFGNRKVTIVAMIFSVLFAGLLFLSIPLRSFGYLCLIRFWLGVTTGVGLKMAYTLLSQHFSSDEVKKLSGYLLASFSLAPGLAIFIVGALVSWIGYTGAFYFQLVYCLLGLIVGCTLPHGHHDTHHPIHPMHILSKYWQCLKEPRLLLPGILMTAGPATIYLFTSEAPFITIKYLKASPLVYGLLFFLMCFGNVIGAYVAGKTVHRLRKMHFIFIGLLTITLGSLAMLVSFLAGWIFLLTLFLPMIIIRMGSPLVVANAASYALGFEKHSKSYISSTINFISLAIAVLFVLVQSAFRADHYFLLPILLVVVVVIGWMGFAVEKKLIRS